MGHKSQHVPPGDCSSNIEQSSGARPWKLLGSAMEIVQTAAIHRSASVRIGFQVVIGVNTYGINAEISHSNSPCTFLLFVTLLLQYQEKNSDSELPFRDEWMKTSAPKNEPRSSSKSRSAGGKCNCNNSCSCIYTLQHLIHTKCIQHGTEILGTEMKAWYRNET